MSLEKNEKAAELGRLVIGIAHEIRNPLGYVISNLATLKIYLSAVKDAFVKHDEFIRAAADACPEFQKGAMELRAFENGKKLPYILGDIENLLLETGQGVDRMKEIIQKLREFEKKWEDQDFDSMIGSVTVKAVPTPT